MQFVAVAEGGHAAQRTGGLPPLGGRPGPVADWRHDRPGRLVAAARRFHE
jgi:hypothetical protein